MKINPRDLDKFLDEETDAQEELEARMAQEKLDAKRRKAAAVEHRREKANQEK